MIVVDASLIVRTISWEEGSAAALDFVDSYPDELVAPDLVLSEVGSAIVRRANMGEMPAEAAEHALSAWAKAVREGLLSLHPMTPGDMERAARLAITLGHPIADCFYLALAMDLDCGLATCDAKFAAKARSVYPAITVLATKG